MQYNKSEVIKIVREVLGEDATGVYIHNQVVSKDLDYDDMPLVSQLGEHPFIIENTKKYEVHYGLTRLCIYPINKRINWVIKIPITGVYAENYFEDDNDSNICDGDFYSWEGDNFLGLTQVGTCECDSCDEENVIYEESSYNAKKFMAKIIILELIIIFLFIYKKRRQFVIVLWHIIKLFLDSIQIFFAMKLIIYLI